MHVVGKVREWDTGSGALDADGADEQPHLTLLASKHMFDTSPDLRFGGIGLGGALGHRLAESWGSNPGPWRNGASGQA